MWKHWLGLPSQYYDDEVGAGAGAGAGAGVGSRPQNPTVVAASAAMTAAAPAAAAVDATATGPVRKKVYSKDEIADAVKTLRAAASRRYPDDPQVHTPIPNP
jgi:hypothetical protein